jgi:Domain of unknown function (DUF4159)
VLGAPPPAAESLAADARADLIPTAQHPPGLYGPPGAVRALNAVNAGTKLVAISGLPSGIVRIAYQLGDSVSLKPWALLAALGLVLADILAVLALQTGGFRRMRPLGRAAAALAIVFIASAGVPDPAHAQSAGTTASETGDFALKAAERTRLAYVTTGDAETDETSKRGLTGLSLVLASRTAVEPDTPMAVRVDVDELAFFPVLYWPVLPNAEPLKDAVVAKIDAYTKGGGMIVFDTRDAGDFTPTTDAAAAPGALALRRLVAKLDVPPLEPTPGNHVLGRSFYILTSFPGRYDSSPMWVETAGRPGERENDSLDTLLFNGGDQGSTGTTPREQPVRQDDGVSALLVTGNDLAGAWAVDDDGLPLNAVIPGGEEQREQAFRVGVNIVMYALTGNYKADQVHVPALLERLGQ